MMLKVGRHIARCCASKHGCEARALIKFGRGSTSDTLGHVLVKGCLRISSMIGTCVEKDKQ